MLTSSVGYSIKKNSYESGIESAKIALEKVKNPTIAFLYTSVKYNQSEVIAGVNSILGEIPIIGCNSDGAIIVPDGIVNESTGFSGVMLLEDPDMKIGLAISNHCGNARQLGHNLALEAMEDAGMGNAPDYIYMIASSPYEEEYLRGIEDVVGKVPLFGGGIVDYTKLGSNFLFTQASIVECGVAVAFIYTNKKIITEYTGSYGESEKSGVVTKLGNSRNLIEIDGVPSLKKYAEWIGESTEDLMGRNLAFHSVLNPLGIKDFSGEFIAIRQPIFGHDDYSMEISQDLALNTAVICMESTTGDLIYSTKSALEQTKKKMENNVGAYLLIHSGNRKKRVETQLDEVYNHLKKVTDGIPFMTVFTLGEYGYSDHSANTCGELMLSFTGFSKE